MTVVSYCVYPIMMIGCFIFDLRVYDCSVVSVAQSILKGTLVNIIMTNFHKKY